MDINKVCTHCMNEVNVSNGTPCPVCGHILEQSMEITHQLKPFTILQGKYLVGDVLGEGGFGITYIGFDLNLEMKVAIKEFYPNGYATREAVSTNALTVYSGQNAETIYKWRDNFLKEARSLGKCSHLPGVVGVRDFFQENNTAYIVLEYLEGTTLKNYAKSMGGKIPASMLLPALEPIFIALEEVHRQGLIHRDISPDNIMLLPGGQMKLLDFGAARDYTEGGEKSLSVMLKPGYAPEEQYRSKGKQGPWSDIYALAGTIYKCLTGVTPPEAMERMREDGLRRPNELGAGLAPAQEGALLKAMSVFAEGRYQTVGEFQRDLYAEPIRQGTTRGDYKIPSEPAVVQNVSERERTMTGQPNITRATAGTSTASPISASSAGEQSVTSHSFRGKSAPDYKKIIIGVVLGLAAIWLIVSAVNILSSNGNEDSQSYGDTMAEQEMADDASTEPVEPEEAPAAEPDVDTPAKLNIEKCEDLKTLIGGLAYWADVELGEGTEIYIKDIEEWRLISMIQDIMGFTNYYQALPEENEEVARQAGREFALSREQMDDIASSATGTEYHFSDIYVSSGNGEFIGDYLTWDHYAHAQAGWYMDNYAVEKLGNGEWAITADSIYDYWDDLGVYYAYRVTATVRYNRDSCFNGYSVSSIRSEMYAYEDAAESQYMLPDSDKKYLTLDDLAGFTQEDCRIARNELYARYGRRFDDEALQAHFDSCDWYEGTISPEDFDDTVLNEYEMANRDLIVEYEELQGYR